jgi:hypothetical protein
MEFDMPGFTRTSTRYNKNPARRKIPGVGGETYRGARTPISVSDATVTTTQVDVTFDQPVILKGVPGWTSTSGVIVSATSLSPTIVRTVWTLTQAATLISCPFEDPGIRNSAGGYIRNATIINSGV